MENKADDDDELMITRDPPVQAWFEELEREGEIRQVDWTLPDKEGRVFPVYERVPPKERVQAVFDCLERDGLAIRIGERRGKPVYGPSPLGLEIFKRFPEGQGT